jgi:hypothetical protein
MYGVPFLVAEAGSLEDLVLSAEGSSGRVLALSGRPEAGFVSTGSQGYPGL